MSKKWGNKFIMNKDLLNILSNSNKDIDNQKLMDYLAGKLSDSEKNEVERWIAEQDHFGEDALEGLEAFSGNKDIQLYVDDLNKDLNKFLKDKKARREKRRIRENPWALVTLVVILVIVVVGYWVIRKLMG